MCMRVCGVVAQQWGSRSVVTVLCCVESECANGLAKQVLLITTYTTY